MSSTALILISILGGAHLLLSLKSKSTDNYGKFVEPYKYIKNIYAAVGLSDSEVKDLLKRQYSPLNWKYSPLLGFQEVPTQSTNYSVSVHGYRHNSKPAFSSANPAHPSSSVSPPVQEVWAFGGSTMFGYGVDDRNTIPSHMEAFDPSLRVINYGRGYYYSFQENILFNRLLTEGLRPPQVAIFLDGLNERCSVEVYQTEMLKAFRKIADPGYSWNPGEYAKPFVILASKLFRNVQKVGINAYESSCVNSLGDKLPLSKVFENTIRQRDAICNEFGVRCLTFVQPLPGIRNKHLNLDPAIRVRLGEKYSMIKETMSSNKNLIDLTGSISGVTPHAFVDQYHYSPNALKAIAQKIINNL